MISRLASAQQRKQFRLYEHNMSTVLAWHSPKPSVEDMTQMARAGAGCWWASVDTNSITARQRTELRHPMDSFPLLDLATVRAATDSVRTESCSFTQHFESICRISSPVGSGSVLPALTHKASSQWCMAATKTNPFHLVLQVSRTYRLSGQ